MRSRPPTDDSPTPARFGPEDPEYRATLDRRFNKRFTSSPDHVVRAASTEHVLAALQQAVDAQQRVAVISGGHCLDGLVSDPDVRVLIDVSPMKRVAFDPERRAVMVEAGATVGETSRALFENWGTLIPLGEYPGIGMGGHVVGGAFGFFCRQFGLAADHLYAVEVVTVDQGGRARAVVATRDADDPNRELWWAHTGAGGGNFGIVTRYWFRSYDASGDDPRTLLPAAPDTITTFIAEWTWDDLEGTSGAAAFTRLLANYGAWSEQHSGPDSPWASLWSVLIAHRRQLGKIVLRGVSTAGDRAEQQLHEYLGVICEGLPVVPTPRVARMGWLDFALNPFPDLFTFPPGGVRMKGKDALLRTRLTDAQAAIAYDYLTRTDHDVMGGILGLATYGCRVNTLAPDATASVHRNSILDFACSTGWLDPREDAQNLAWVRAFYAEMLASTGGAPVPSDAYDGTLINHPDVDLADPAWNRSGVPWTTLYYGANYPRLQRVKARWDPRNVFHHALSIRGG